MSSRRRRQPPFKCQTNLLINIISFLTSIPISFCVAQTIAKSMKKERKKSDFPLHNGIASLLADLKHITETHRSVGMTKNAGKRNEKLWKRLNRTADCFTECRAMLQNTCSNVAHFDTITKNSEWLFAGGGDRRNWKLTAKKSSSESKSFSFLVLLVHLIARSRSNWTRECIIQRTTVKPQTTNTSSQSLCTHEPSTVLRTNT